MKTLIIQFANNDLKKIVLYTILLLSIACKKSDNEKGEPFYFKGTVNGQHIEWKAPFVSRSSNERPEFLFGISSPGGSMPFYCATSDLLPYQLSMGSSIFKDDASGIISKNSISVVFVLSSNDYDDASAILKSWFTNGPKSFGLHRDVCTDPVLDGIVIYYGDTDGKTWRSRPFSSNHFEQISLEDETRSQEYLKKWKVRFSCRLFDDSGNYIDMQSCELLGAAFSI
jgi:hypothetical protein